MALLLPKKVKHRKQHRLFPEGVATKGNTVAFGEYGLQATTSSWISNRQIESARIAITKQMKRQGKVWIRIFPHFARTKKPLEVRMGKGKGNPEQWVAVVKEDTVMFEVAGVTEATAREALRLASHKLSVKTRVIKNDNFDPKLMGKKAVKQSIYAKKYDEFFGNEEKGGDQ